MTLSVVVASYNSVATLERCLAALGGDAEVIVADCSARDPRESFAREFPQVRWARSERPMTIPQLRREGLKLAGGQVVAFTEGRIVPAPGWAQALLDAHAAHPEAPAAGGPIDCDPRSAFDAAVFFCEYGRHLPPLADGPAEELSGANLSYKRAAIELCRDLIDAGAWEPFLHRRIRERGGMLWRAGRAVVEYRNSLTAGQFVRQRFHYGRWFAACRVEGAGLLRRLAYAGFCPLLPLLLTARLGGVVFRRRRLRGRFLLALPWIVAFQTVWSAGEFCGYLGGKGASDRQVF